jgi:kynurenine formamidase
MNVHTPGWVGYAGNKMDYAQNLQTQMIVAQRIDTALHVGTHFDGAMHATDNRKKACCTPKISAAISS